MATAPTQVSPSVSIVNGQPVTTSTDIAQHFGKRHGDVIRAIRDLDCSENFRQRNFASSSKDVEMPNGGKKSIAFFVITRDGFTFLCMGFTGAEAAKWKEAYINAFNTMEKALCISSETITPEQQNAIHQAIAALSNSDGKKRAGLWSRFNNHFKLGSYKQLPSTKFDEAAEYLKGLQGEHTHNARHELPKSERNHEALAAFMDMFGDVRAVLSLGPAGKQHIRVLPPELILVDPAHWSRFVTYYAPVEQLPKIIEAASSKLFDALKKIEGTQ